MMRDPQTDYKPEPIDFQTFLMSRGFKPTLSERFRAPGTTVFTRGDQRIAFTQSRNETPPFVSFFHAGLGTELKPLITYQKVPTEQVEADRILNLLAMLEKSGGRGTTIQVVDLKTGKTLDPIDPTTLSEDARKRIERGINKYFRKHDDQFAGHPTGEESSQPGLTIRHFPKAISEHETPPEFEHWGPPSLISDATRQRIREMFRDDDVKVVSEYPPCEHFAKRDQPALDFLDYLKQRGYKLDDTQFVWIASLGRQRIFGTKFFGKKKIFTGISGRPKVYHQPVPADALEADRLIQQLEERDKEPRARARVIHKLTTDYEVTTNHPHENLKADCAWVLKQAETVDGFRVRRAMLSVSNVVMPGDNADQDRLCYFCSLMNKPGRVSYWEDTDKPKS